MPDVQVAIGIGRWHHDAIGCALPFWPKHASTLPHSIDIWLVFVRVVGLGKFHGGGFLTDY